MADGPHDRNVRYVFFALVVIIATIAAGLTLIVQAWF